MLETHMHAHTQTNPITCYPGSTPEFQRISTSFKGRNVLNVTSVSVIALVSSFYDLTKRLLKCSWT